MNSYPSDYLMNIPCELLLTLMGLLNLRSLFSLSRVCRYLLKLILRNHKILKFDYNQPTFRHAVVIDTIRNNDIRLFGWLEFDRRVIPFWLANKYCDEAANSGSIEILKLFESPIMRRIIGIE